MAIRFPVFAHPRTQENSSFRFGVMLIIALVLVIGCDTSSFSDNLQKRTFFTMESDDCIMEIKIPGLVIYDLYFTLTAGDTFKNFVLRKENYSSRIKISDHIELNDNTLYLFHLKTNKGNAEGAFLIITKPNDTMIGSQKYVLSYFDTNNLYLDHFYVQSYKYKKLKK